MFRHCYFIRYFGGREAPIENVSSKLIFDKLSDLGHNNVVLCDKKDLVRELDKIIEPNSMIITMGAGDVFKYGKEIIKILTEKMKKVHQEYILEKFPSLVKIDESMKKHSSFGIGGKAKILFLPQNTHDLKSILKYSSNNGIDTYVMGSGSNILISDKGFNGILISLKRSFKNLDFYDNGEIIAGSGVMLRRMVKEAIDRNLKGLESLAGVPGTLGGALYMNAGAYGAEISNYFLSARMMNMNGEEIELSKDNVRFSYRKSTFLKIVFY